MARKRTAPKPEESAQPGASPPVAPEPMAAPVVHLTHALGGGRTLLHTDQGPMIAEPNPTPFPDSLFIPAPYDAATGAVEVAGHQVPAFTDDDVMAAFADHFPDGPWPVGQTQSNSAPAPLPERFTR